MIAGGGAVMTGTVQLRGMRRIRAAAP